MKISRDGVSVLGVVEINKTAKCQPAETPHSTRETLLLRNCGISKLQSAITQFNCDSFCRLNNYELCHRFLRPRTREDEIATANSWSKKSLLLWLRLDEKSFVKRKMKKVVSAFLLAANVCSVKLNDSFKSERVFVWIKIIKTFHPPWCFSRPQAFFFQFSSSLASSSRWNAFTKRSKLLLDKTNGHDKWTAGKSHKN